MGYLVNHTLFNERHLPSYSSSKQSPVIGSADTHTHTHTDRLQYPRYVPTHSEVNNVN